MAFLNAPLFTREYNRAEDIYLSANSAYIFSSSVEERSDHLDSWRENCSDILFVRIVSQSHSGFIANVQGVESSYSLKPGSIRRFLDSLGRDHVYVDITGLTHNVWAPIIKALVAQGSKCSAVYVEPEEYKYSLTPTESQIFDLSEMIRGVEPIPGFANLREAKEDETCFIPLLGFEGIRLSHLIEQLQPPEEKIIPVIGLPGFKPQYPFNSYLGNKLPLLETKAWKNVRYARANCPFSVYRVIEEIAADNPSDFIRLALIGTKPHALGGIMYSLLSGKIVEVIYDHPIRKNKRTSGINNILVYDISKFYETVNL